MTQHQQSVNALEAYQAWIDSGIKGIGEPFFTKWFFICGLDPKASGLQPLVLDSRVWKSLAAIGWSSERQTGTKYRKDPAGAYGAYLEAMRVWASELSDGSVKISPLQVEQFFFRKSGKKWRYHFPVGFRGSQCLREGLRNRPSFEEKGILPSLQD